jgi:hypothetical protein
MYIRIRPPVSSCDCKPPRSKKQEDKTSVTLLYLGIESLAYWSRAADENFSFAAVWWIHAASSCLDLYERSEINVQGMCLMPDKTQSKSWQVWGMCILPKKNSIRIQMYPLSVKSRKATTHWPHLITEEQMCSILCVYWSDFRAKKQQERCYMVSINLLRANIPIMTSASGMHLAFQYCS